MIYHISYMNRYDLKLLESYKHVTLYTKLIINYYIYDVLMYDILIINLKFNM
jgi:hypothetical protein